MYHYPLIYLSQGKNSTALYSYKKPKSLVIFVHGFSGDAISTWDNFETLIRNSEHFGEVDILFYGYESLKGQIYDQALEFFRFLDDNVSSNNLPMRGLALPPYQKIVIVAHSQGAIVARYGLLEAIKRRCAWRFMCKLLLFAPAHSGARIQQLVMLSIPSFYKIIGGLGLYFTPVLDDLRPESATIQELNKITSSYCGTKEEPLLTASVVHAYGDKVVHNIPFCYDLADDHSPVHKKSHTSICKPYTPDYTIPFEILKRQV